MKTFFLDTNVLLEDPDSIDSLSDNGKNNVVIPYSVILELDRLKKNINKSHLVSTVVDRLLSDIYPKHQIYRRKDFKYSSETASDNTIIDDLNGYINRLTYVEDETIFFISNDKLLRFRVSEELGILTQDYKNSRPFLSDTEIYTGVVSDGDERVRNCFYWREGKLYFERNDKLIDYENEIWKVKPKTPYQNMFMELLLNNDIDVVSVQSAPGYGKVFL